MIKHNYQKHPSDYVQAGEEFSKAHNHWIWLCGKESIQTNLISFHNSNMYADWLFSTIPFK